MGWKKITKKIKKIVKKIPIVKKIVKVIEKIWHSIVPKMPDMPDLNDLLDNEGVLLNQRASDAPLPIIYGTRKVGGSIAFISVSTDNQFLYLVLAVCEGQVEGMKELFIDEKLYATYTGSYSAYGTDQTISSTYAVSTSAPSATNLTIDTTHQVYLGKEEKDGVETTHYLTNFAFFNGTDNGVNYNSIFSELSSLGWTSSHLGKGVTSAAFRFKYNADAFNGLPKIQFLIKGKKINTVPNGTASYNYSANPIYQVFDYLTSTRYGKGLPTSVIDTATFATAGGICDGTVTPFTGASTQPLFSGHTFVGAEGSLIDNVKKIMSATRSYFVYTGGKYKVQIEGTGSSVLTFTEDMIVGGMVLQGETKDTRFNRVIARFPDEDEGYHNNEAVYPPSDETNVASAYQYATMLAEDNNEQLEMEISLDSVTNYYQAEDLAEYVLKKSRNSIGIGFNATSEGTNVVIGDIIKVTYSSFGFSEKEFLVEGITIHPQGIVGIEAIEYQSSIYTFGAKTQKPDTPTTNLPDPTTVQAPVLTSITDTAVNVTEGNLNVIMTVTFRGTSDFFVDKYEVVYKKSTDSIYKSAGLSSNTVREIPVESSTTYNVKVRAINSLNYKSAYVAGDHYVVGFEDPPANVTGLSIDYQDEIAVLKWDTSTDLDLGYYHIRYSPNTADSYNDSIILVDKVSPPANSVIVPAKAGVYFIKAFDLLGHESLTAGSIIGTVSEFAGQNLALTLTEETAFAGTKSQVVVDGSSLILAGDDVTLFDAVTGLFDDKVGFFDEVDGFESTGTYTFANQFSLPNKYQGRVSSYLNVDQLDRVSSFDGHAGLFDSAQGLFDDAGASPQMDAKLFISTSDDDSTYTAFTPFQDGNYEFRYAKFQLQLTSSVSSQSPKVNNAQVRLYMMDRVDKGQNIASGAGAKAVTFNTAFYAEPSVTILAQNAAHNTTTTITSKSATGFTVAFNHGTSGAAQDVTFDYVANGQGSVI